MAHRRFTLFFVLVLALPCFSSGQNIYDEPFPKLPFDKHSERIVGGNDSSFFVVGSTTDEFQLFEDINGITIPYYFRKIGAKKLLLMK